MGTTACAPCGVARRDGGPQSRGAAPAERARTARGYCVARAAHSVARAARSRPQRGLRRRRGGAALDGAPRHALVRCGRGGAWRQRSSRSRSVARLRLPRCALTPRCCAGCSDARRCGLVRGTARRGCACRVALTRSLAAPFSRGVHLRSAATGPVCAVLRWQRSAERLPRLQRPGARAPAARRARIRAAALKPPPPPFSGVRSRRAARRGWTRRYCS